MIARVVAHCGARACPHRIRPDDGCTLRGIVFVGNRGLLLTGGTRVPVACRDCQPSSGDALHQLAADLVIRRALAGPRRRACGCPQAKSRRWMGGWRRPPGHLPKAGWVQAESDAVTPRWPLLQRPSKGDGDPITWLTRDESLRTQAGLPTCHGSWLMPLAPQDDVIGHTIMSFRSSRRREWDSRYSLWRPRRRRWPCRPRSAGHCVSAAPPDRDWR